MAAKATNPQASLACQWDPVKPWFSWADALPAQWNIALAAIVLIVNDLSMEGL
jgi:hypothetical protein